MVAGRRWIALCAFVLCPAALAQGKPDTPEAAAGKVLAALEANDAEALAALAKRFNPDPWLVADALCAQGRHDAAEALAKADARKDLEKLAAYVRSRRGVDDKDARAALAKAQQALAKRRIGSAVGAIRRADTSGTSVVSVRLLHAKALALRTARRSDQAMTAFVATADAAEKLGWLARAADTLRDAMMVAYQGADPAGVAIAKRKLEVEKVRGIPGRIAISVGHVGTMHKALQQYEESLPYQLQAVELKKAAGDIKGVADTTGNIGVLYQFLRRYDEGIKYQQRAIAVYEELGFLGRVPWLLGNIGVMQRQRKEFKEALTNFDRAVKLAEKAKDEAALAWLLDQIASVLREQGRTDEALTVAHRGLALCRKLGQPVEIATALAGIAKTHRYRGEPREARPFRVEVLRIREGLKDPKGIADAALFLGGAERGSGDFDAALAQYRRAQAIYRKLGDRKGLAECLNGIAGVHYSRGELAGALSAWERHHAAMVEIGTPADVGIAVGSLSAVHFRLGNNEKALELNARAIAVFEERKDRRSLTMYLANHGNILNTMGRYEEALDHHERALVLAREVGDKINVGASLAVIGGLYGTLGRPEKALPLYEESLRIMTELGNLRGQAVALGNMGDTYAKMGKRSEAMTALKRARAVAAEAGFLVVEVTLLSSLAQVDARNDPAAAIRAARTGIAKMPALVAGLAEGQGATARDQWSGLMEAGVAAGVNLGNAAEVSFFIESGRAGALLESLGGRAKVGEGDIPAALRTEERAARAAVLEARARLERARAARNRKEVKAARAGLESAQAAVLATVAKIQRAAKAIADVAYPKAADLKEIQAQLEPNEALLSYATTGPTMVVLVVTRERARIVSLPTTHEAFLLESPDKPWKETVKRLRKELIEPLGLEGETTRLLVSPVGGLSYVPFGMLAPGREVVYVPSGTTYRVLRGERGKRGDKVLTLGDPDYGATRDAVAAKVYRQRAGLARLPGTRVEAKAVGDVVLLGADANEALLKETLAKSKRWRAVHFACHGLVNAEQPQLSSLALSPDADNDGFLTVLEVFQSRIPADLVVLSACETARGKVHRAEGIIGFTRAFMLAGAPRVIVSLWKVDDDATRALMVKFYELWKPGKLSTAAALKKAQAYVASHEKWRHPYYWAAWQLWGLPE
jgi:CHAT domain-containing protein/tetratricopeptide (TPR) repeat protein